MSLTAIAYLVAFCALLAGALFANPRYGLYAYIATFYLHPIDRWWGSDLPDVRWSLIAAAVTLIATLRLPAANGRDKWATGRGVGLLIALTTWIWIQNLWALSPEEHFELSILFTKYLVLIYLIYRLVDDERAVGYFLFAHVLGCFYLSVLVLQAPDGGRLEGIGGPGIDEANTLGMHLGTGAIAAAALMVGGSIPLRIFAIAALTLIVNGIVQTESRGAFLALAAGALVMYVLSPPKFRPLWVVLGVAGLAVLLRVAPESFWQRMTTINEATSAATSEDQSVQTRQVLLAAQWRMFVDYPMGSGHRGTAYLSPRYLDARYLSRTRREIEQDRQARSSHNTFMTALTEHGFPGALIFTSLILWIARTCLTIKRELSHHDRERQRLNLMAVGGSLGMIIAAGAFTDYFKAEVFIWNIALLSVIATLAKEAAAEPDIKEAIPSSSLQADVRSGERPITSTQDRGSRVREL